jgi:apolipoprotein N-acyltransferase
MEKILQKKQVLYAVLSGVLLALSFPPINLNILAFFAFIPLLILLADKETKHPYLLSYITFFIFHVASNWWISSWRVGTNPYLMASGLLIDFVHPLFFLLPIIVFRFFNRHLGSKIALRTFPFIWAAYEWLHSLGDLGYPWLSIGKSQIIFLPWIQFIDLIGVIGAGFFIVMINVLLLEIIEYSRENKLNFFKSLIKKPIQLALIVVFIIAPVIYGFIQLDKYDHKKMLAENEHLNVALVQPAYDAWIKWESSPLSMVERHFNLLDSLIATKQGDIDLAVWPETAIPYLGWSFSVDHNFALLEQYVESRNVPLLVGFADTKVYTAKNAPEQADALPMDTSIKYISYNATLMLNKKPYENAQPRIYHKMRLTPFAERVPYVEHLGFLKSLMKSGVGLSAWGKGGDHHNVTFYKGDKRHTIASIICIESIFPGFIRKFTNMGAELLVIQTNDAWYDYTTGPGQHYDIARIRAIENRRYIARCANTGISGWIAPTGRSLGELKHYVPNAGVLSLPLLKEKSLYVRSGDWFPKLCSRLVEIMFIIVLYQMIVKKKRKSGKIAKI